VKTKGKRTKLKGLSFPFFCFRSLFGIEPFQRVTTEKSEKILFALRARPDMHQTHVCRRPSPNAARERSESGHWE
jgi:hypothetical protein